MTAKVKTLPQDQQAEVYVLGAMLNSINAVNHCIEVLDSSDFYFIEHQIIFQGIKALYRQGFAASVDSVAREALPSGKVSLQQVAGIYMEGADVDWEHYCEIVLNLSRLRRVIMASYEASKSCYELGASSMCVLKALQNKLFQAQGIGMEETKTPRDVLDDFHQGANFEANLDWMQEQVRQGKKPYQGVSSGYTKLDEALGYFRPGCFYTIGARTSMGKTTFLLNLIRNMNMFGRRTSVGFFSLEMPANIITAKLLCLFTGIKYSRYDDAVFNDEEKERFKAQAKIMRDFPLFIEDQSGLKISQVCSRAKRMKQNHGIDILFVDYLTLIKADHNHSNNHLAVNEISKGLQQLAKELHIPIIVLAQLNRSLVGKDDNIPQLSHFRESGAIEEDSDACLMLHRPSYYDPNVNPGISKLYIRKNRIRGQLPVIEFNIPYGEVYHELENVSEEIRRIQGIHDKDDFDDLIN